MRGIPLQTKSSERPNSAENTGTAFSTPTYRRGPGPFKKIDASSSTFSNWKAPKSGQKYLSSWKDVHKMHSKIVSTS